MEVYKNMMLVRDKKIQISVHETTKGFVGRFINSELPNYDLDPLNEDDHYGVFLRADNGEKIIFETLEDAKGALITFLN